MAEARRRHQVLSRSTRRISTAYSPKLDEARLPFVVAVRQGSLHWNSRSTVATATGLLQRLRDVMIRHSEVRTANGPLSPPTAEDIANWCFAHYKGNKIIVFATIERRVLGPLWPHIEKAVKLKSDLSVSVVETGTSPPVKGERPEKFKRATTKTQRDLFANIGAASIVGDRRLLSSLIKTALGVARKPDAICLLIERASGSEFVEFESTLIDTRDPRVYWPPTQSLLSFNSRLPRSGRCTRCDGLGSLEQISETSLVGNASKPVADGGLSIPYETANFRYKYFPPLSEELRGLLIEHGLPLKTCWQDLTAKARSELLNGSGTRAIQPRKPDGTPRGKRKPFLGLIELLRSKASGKDAGSSVVKTLLRVSTCLDCGGTRLNHAAQSIYFGKKFFPDIIAQTLTEAGVWLRAASKDISDPQAARVLISLALLCEACERLGLGHLALSRPVSTLSGGEAQRLRIAEALISKLHGGCYALDEPTRGLHAADAILLSQTLRDLVDVETTVLLVEHNPVIVAGADNVIEMGPIGGRDGGKVVFAGPPVKSPLLNTAISRPAGSVFTQTGRIEVEGIQCRNIRNQNVTIPLGGLVCVTGVSGSGKSTLVRDVLTPSLQAWIDTGVRTGPNFKRLSVEGRIDRLVYVSQNALSTNPRSLLLTFLGVADEFRSWFHRVSDAEELGLESGHFSSNTDIGQCPACEGLGCVSQSGGGITVCSACRGTRFHANVLFAKRRGKSVDEWLSSDLTFLSKCEDTPCQLRAAAQLAHELGIGHLSPARSLPSLSGGECQRLRIVKALMEARPAPNGKPLHQLFVMDEPAAGLHPEDVDRLNKALHRVVLGGANTLILVEHNLSIIRLADWIIDVGPCGADQGGQILFAGPVDNFLQRGPEESRTRQALRSKLSQRPKQKRAVTEAHSNDNRSASESIQAFREYLALSEGERDADEISSPAHPSYLISAGGDDAYEDHRLFGLLNLALPIQQLYAAESSVPGDDVFSDESAVCEAAVVALQKSNRLVAGWFPLVSLANKESVCWPDIRRAVKDGMSKGAYGWFDGSTLQRKAPTTTLDRRISHSVRLVLSPELTAKEAVHRAFALGEGWLSVIDPSSGVLKDFTIRALDKSKLRVGSRWCMPQIFDSGIESNSCRLCKGEGNVESIDAKLIVASEGASILQDKFFTKQALEAVRGSRRRQMMPIVERLAEAELVDLSLPFEKMPSETSDALWFGYPDKSFLRTGGDEKCKGDWYEWLGLVSCVISNMWKAPDRNWATKVHESRHFTICPRCKGTGLGWEARLRAVKGITIQAILSSWTLERLNIWLSNLSCHSDLGKRATATAKTRLELPLRLGLSNLKCGCPFNDLSKSERLKVFAIACSHNQLLGAAAYVRPTEDYDNRSIKILIKHIQEEGNMRWVEESRAQKRNYNVE